MNKTYLKGKGKLITESLTAFRMQNLKMPEMNMFFLTFGQLMVK